MVWFLSNSIASVGSQTCGNMLSNIASGKQSCCQNHRNSIFKLFDDNQDKTDYSHYFDNMYLWNPNSSSSNDLSQLGPLLNQDLITPGGSGFFNEDFMCGANFFNPLMSMLMSGIWSRQNPATSAYGTAAYSPANWTGAADLSGLVSYASSWVGKINNDAQGNAQFSGGARHAWCADFVTYCVKQVLGGKLPPDFGSAAVSGLRAWGIKHNCYVSTPEARTEQNMRNFLKNIKPGDIMIQKRNGRSHTGIVQSVAPDGSSYTVVEGNCSNKVKTVKYKATDGYLSGFVCISRIVK